MTRQQITDLPIYPEDRSCTAPTAARVFDHLAPDLVGVPANAYTSRV
jgi:hypothetical protein